MLVPRERFADGESLQRLVVRSRAGVSAEQEAAELAGLVAPARPDAVYRPTCERHVVPPKVSLQSVERHGLLDRDSVDDATLAATYNLARKEKGRLADTSVVDVTTGQPVALPDPAAVETVAATPRGGGYLVHHEEQLALPYLPDPFASSASLCGLPGVPAPGREGIADAHGLAFVPTALPPDVLLQLGGAPVQIPFSESAQGDGWPQRPPFRLVLVAAPPGPHLPPTWDPQARMLAVALPPAEQARVRLSSAVNRHDLAVLGQWRWLLDAHPEMHGDAVAVDVAEHGGRWQLTPPQMLTLVHAVEAPLASPDFAALSAPRQRATTFAYLTGDLAVHGKSTAKVDLVATWQDSGDRPGAPGTPASRHVFEIPVHLPGDDVPASTDDPGVVPIASYEPDRCPAPARPRPGRRVRTHLPLAASSSGTPGTARSPTRRSPPAASGTASRPRWPTTLTASPGRGPRRRSTCPARPHPPRPTSCPCCPPSRGHAGERTDGSFMNGASAASASTCAAPGTPQVRASCSRWSSPTPPNTRPTTSCGRS